MKTLFIYSAILFSVFSPGKAGAQTITDSVKVWGNCGMCKAKIEKAAKAAGAATASWNETSMQLTLQYNGQKTSSLKIQQAVAKQGYDTQDITGDNNAYKKLDHCCQYDRRDAAVKKH